MDSSGKVAFIIIGISRMGPYVAEAFGNWRLPTAQNYRDEDYRKTGSASFQFTAVEPRVSFNGMSR
jgi:hypothetical protein